MAFSKEKIEGLVAINIAAIIFGSAALFGKMDISPFWIVALRSGFAALTLYIVAKIKKEPAITFLTPAEKHLTKNVLMSGIILAFHWLTFFTAVLWGGVALATLTFAAFPLFTILIETLTQRRRPHPIEIGAGIAIICAVAILIDLKQEATINGGLMGLLSAISFSLFGLASQKMNRVLSPVKISFMQNAVVFIFLTPFLYTEQKIPQLPYEWLLLILLGVVTTALMHQLYFYALRRLSASTCSGFVALEPVYAILFAALFFGDPLYWNVCLSAILIIGSSYVLLKYEHQTT